MASLLNVDIFFISEYKMGGSKKRKMKDDLVKIDNFDKDQDLLKKYQKVSKALKVALNGKS